jgi:hypothetical protein
LTSAKLGVVVTVTVQMHYPNTYSRATIVNIEADPALLEKFQPLKVVFWWFVSGLTRCHL